jgi:hypothetical protein
VTRPDALWRLTWGVGVAALYLAAVSGAWGWRIPPRLLYDGFSPPPPYHWVRPPSSLAASNQRLTKERA